MSPLLKLWLRKLLCTFYSGLEHDSQDALSALLHLNAECGGHGHRMSSP